MSKILTIILVYLFIITFIISMRNFVDELFSSSSSSSSSFSDIFLTKSVDVSTIYLLQVVLGLNCNEDVSVSINFYDNGYEGHYKYFFSKRCIKKLYGYNIY